MRLHQLSYPAKCAGCGTHATHLPVGDWETLYNSRMFVLTYLVKIRDVIAVRLLDYYFPPLEGTGGQRRRELSGGTTTMLEDAYVLPKPVVSNSLLHRVPHVHVTHNVERILKRIVLAGLQEPLTMLCLLTFTIQFLATAANFCSTNMANSNILLFTASSTHRHLYP